jgi:diguanylate cyclase (GGDEF)-like protein
LCNRVNFLKALDERMAANDGTDQQIAVHFIDIDDFKSINDSRGHSIGDRFLCLVAQRLTAALRDGDMAARLGGDEFAILQSEVTEIEEVSALAESIRRSLSAPYELGGQRFYTTATIGVALFPCHGSNADDLLRKADLALYDGKAAGGDAMRLFDQGLIERQHDREQMLRELEEALANRQFMVHYQPIMALASGRVTGMEALIRWQHPVQGLLQADRFITVLEATPWFPAVGAYVLRQACRQMKAWHDDGFSSLRMSVNLSMYQIKQPGLVELVAGILHDTGLSPGALELELTESAILSAGLADVAEVLQRLRNLGVHIALDDFGTGYSSLTFLKRFPVGRIKIDRSFVADLGACEEDAAIVRAVIQLGKNLDIDVTAEGVETMAAASFLLKAGCSEQQGFMTGPPMSAERMADFLEQRRPPPKQIQIGAI